MHSPVDTNVDFFLHETARCDSKKVGLNTRIWGYTHILAGAQIGARTNIGEHVFIEDDVRIGNGCTIKNGVSLWNGITLGDHVFIGPNAVFTNDLRPRAFLKKEVIEFRPTVIRKGASIGANSTILCGITIGEFAMIGAGSVVTKDVPSHALVVGNPGRIVSRVCFCGEKLDEKDYCEACALPLDLNSMQFTIRTKGIDI